MKMQLIVYVSQIKLLDTRCLLFHWGLRPHGTGGFKSKHLVYAEYWTRIGFQTICDVTNQP